SGESPDDGSGEGGRDAEVFERAGIAVGAFPNSNGLKCRQQSAAFGPKFPNLIRYRRNREGTTMRVRSLGAQGSGMGLTYTMAAVEALDATPPPFQARFLADTGATDCLLPAALLRSAGIQPEGTSLYELADGRTVQLEFGWVRLRFMNTVAIAKVVFGPEDAEPILGVIALESAGVSVDPLTNTLKRLATRSLKRAAACNADAKIRDSRTDVGY